MPEPSCWPGGEIPGGLSAQEQWILSYAGWYRHYLSMQLVQDHLATRWAESMSDAVVGAAWFSPFSHSPEKHQRLKEGFARLKATFLSDRSGWLQKLAPLPTPASKDEQVSPPPTRIAQKTRVPRKMPVKGEQLSLFA